MSYSMREPTTIAGLVKSLLEDGVEHEAIVRAVEAAEKGVRRPMSTKASNRGTRLPEDWEPRDAEIAYAAAFQMPDTLIALEAQKFKNYWTAKTGAGATKRDWSATWRNWILNAMERRHDAAVRQSGAIQPTGRPATGTDAIVAAMDRVARRRDADRKSAQSEKREVGRHADPTRLLDFDRSGKT